jgi:hypothetical protein
MPFWATPRAAFNGRLLGLFWVRALVRLSDAGSSPETGDHPASSSRSSSERTI